MNKKTKVLVVAVILVLALSTTALAGIYYDQKTISHTATIKSVGMFTIPFDSYDWGEFAPSLAPDEKTVTTSIENTGNRELFLGYMLEDDHPIWTVVSTEGAGYTIDSDWKFTAWDVTHKQQVCPEGSTLPTYISVLPNGVLEIRWTLCCFNLNAQEQSLDFDITIFAHGQLPT